MTVYIENGTFTIVEIGSPQAVASSLGLGALAYAQVGDWTITADGTASGRAFSGSATAITSAGKQLVSAAGGLGGLNGQAPRSGNNGEGTAYGPGGAGGNVNSAGSAAPSSSYGAGGGGGGGDNPSTYDSSGAGGFGGLAGTRRIGSIEAAYGSVLIVSVGARGLGSTAGYHGGDGAAGYARLIWDEKAASFTASGSVVVA